MTGFFSFDPRSLTITRATAILSSMLGYMPEELISSPLSRVWPDEAKREQFIQLISEVEAVRDHPADLASRDGTLLPVTITAASPDTEITCIISPRPGEQDYPEIEGHLRSLDSLRDAVLIFDPDGTILFANTAVAALSGASSPAELLGQNIFKFIHPGHTEPLVSDIENMQAGRGGYLARYPIRALHGNERWVEGFGAAILFEGQKANLIIFRDITEMRIAEDERARASQEFRDLYHLVRMMCDNVPDLIWAKDTKGRYLFANKATCEKVLNAVDTDEPVGKTDMFFAEREQRAHPENPDWHTFGEICRDTDVIVMESGRPERFDEYGNVKGEYLVLDVNKAPFLDDEGDIIGIVGCGRDVTEERQVEERLRWSEALLTHMAQTSPVAYFVVDGRTDEVLYFNKSFSDIWGLSHLEDDMRAGKIKSSDVISLCAPLFCNPEAFTASWALLHDEGNRSIIRDEIRLTDGRYIKRFSAQIRDADDRYFGRLHLLEDITEQKRASEALRRHDAIMSAVNFAADRFFKESDWKIPMDEVLARLGRATGVSRVYVFENQIDPETGSLISNQRWRWCAEGAATGVDDPELLGIHYDLMLRWHEKLSAGKPIVGLVRKFPDPEKKYLKPFESQSIAVVPIFVHEQWWGLIGFDECRWERIWSSMEIDALQAAASIIGAAILRRMGEEVYRNPVERSPLGIYLLQDGRLRYFNARLAEIFGYSRDELNNPDAQAALTDPECLDEVREQYRSLLSGDTDSEHHEFCGRHKDGRTIHLENFATRLQFEGRPAVVGTLVDVTERKQMDEALRSSEERLKIIFDYAPDAVILIDEERALVDGNLAAERLLGCAREEFIGRKFYEIAHLPPEDLSRGLAFIDQTAAGATAGPIEMTLIHSDGTRVPVEAAAFPVTIDGQRLVLAIGRDVSERHQLEELKKKALIQIEENIEQLAILNDSIRNPLTVIIALAEMGGTEFDQKIIKTAWEIDEIIRQLDQGWLISRKVQDFLQKHYT